MKLTNLGETNSLLNSFMAQMRDKDIHSDRLRFRTNLHRLGQIFAYEISKTLDYSIKQVETPLGIADIPTFDDKIVISTVIRAGLPLHDGVLDYFEEAENAFIAAFRQYDGSSHDSFHINSEYCATPSLEGKTLILADTMLATGSSLLLAYNRLLEVGGTPKSVHFVCPISSAYAVDFLSRQLPDSVHLWVAAIDPELTPSSYIVPGLGDAGDLAYGEKL